MTLKIISRTAIIGMLLAGLLAVAVSEMEQYYDWLLLKQSIVIGLIVGLAAGIGISYHKKLKHGSNQGFANQMTGNPQVSTVIQQKVVREDRDEIKMPEKSKIGFWGIFARFGLGGLLGLVIGLSGGIWYCADLYSNLNSEAQAWIIFYIPFYAIAVLFFAVLGCGAGAGLGLLFGFAKSSRN